MLACGCRRCGFVAPGVALAVQPAAGGELPLGLGRQALAGPLRRRGVVPGDVDDGVIVLALDVAAPALRGASSTRRGSTSTTAEKSFRSDRPRRSA